MYTILYIGILLLFPIGLFIWFFFKLPYIMYNDMTLDVYLSYFILSLLNTEILFEALVILGYKRIRHIVIILNVI